MSRLFDDHYEFSLGDDLYYRVHDVTPATGNRPHKHADVEAGLDNYTANWECVATSTERRRGSDRLYLVDDAHYIKCSRNGMERAGNCLHISEAAPESLQWAVVSSLFEGIAQRKFGTIKEGVDRAELFDSDGLSFATPREFILARECSQAELDDYFDELAALAVELLSRYHDTASIDDLKALIEWWDDETTDLYREYAYDDWQPAMGYQVVTALDEADTNGWHLPTDPNENGWFFSLLHESALDPDTPELAIDIIESGSADGGEIQLAEEDIDADTRTVHEEATYETVEELAALLDTYMAMTPADFA